MAKKCGHYCKVCGEYKANERFRAEAMQRTSARNALRCLPRSGLRI